MNHVGERHEEHDGGKFVSHFAQIFFAVKI